MMKFMLAIVLLITVGCKSTTLPQVDPKQAALLQRCPVQLPPLEGSTGVDVYFAMRDWAAIYFDCATRHNGLVDVIKEK